MTQRSGWHELFSANPLAIVIFTGGVALQALETFIGAAMLPTVVRDIGGLDLFAWNTTIFIVASILATVFASVRPPRFDTRATYMLAAAGFAIGSLLCGLAPTIIVLLAGRAIQGFGAGLMIATSYAMMRTVFPQHLWPRAMALNSTIWGVATLLGPAIGGVFAEFDLWRLAFIGIVPLAALLGYGVWRLLPEDAGAPHVDGAPIVQIAFVSIAILAISIASLLTDRTDLAAALLILALLAVLFLAIVENQARVRLLPKGAMSLGNPMGLLFATILVLGVSIASDIFTPLFYQRLHGMSPVWAGYVSALVALGWSVFAFIAAGWTGERVRFAIIAAPFVLAASTLLMLLTLAPYNPEGAWPPVALSGLALFALGGGIGMAFQHLSTAVLSSAPPEENNKVSAGLGMVQLFASGLGAAIGGVVVNAAGLPHTATGADVETPARWLFGVFTLICLLGIPLAIAGAGRRRPVPRPAE
jgi:MFS family permease